MAQYPTSAAGDANLFIAVNNTSCVLDGALTDVGGNDGADIKVDETSRFPSAGFITIGGEVISYTGKNSTHFTGITRGVDSFEGPVASGHPTGSQVFANIVAEHHNGLKDEIIAVEADLIALKSALTPATATSTATSVLNRVNMIVNQIKVGFGLTNWYDSISNALTSFLLKAGGTMSGAIAMGANKITGLAAATTAGDALRYEQLAAGSFAGATSYKVGTFTTTGSTGNQAITGVGFQPRLVEFSLGMGDSTFFRIGFGMMDAAGNQAGWGATSEDANSGGRSVISSTLCIALTNSAATDILTATFVSMDSDGFTINVTTASVHTIAYKAFR